PEHHDLTSGLLSPQRSRGRSEESRRRGRSEGDGRQDPDEDDGEDRECNVCFCSYDNVFKTPKLLACGHTFCLECLARINVTSQEIKSLTCPMCRELTELPHGRDLPRLGNNQHIIDKLPAEMQRALSIRFKRSQGKLMLKHPPPKGKPSSVSGAAAAASVLDVGRPPSRMRGRLRRLFHSDQCYYAVVASIITITVALMLVGILAFIIIPRREPAGQAARPGQAARRLGRAPRAEPGPGPGPGPPLGPRGGGLQENGWTFGFCPDRSGASAAAGSDPVQARSGSELHPDSAWSPEAHRHLPVPTGNPLPGVQAEGHLLPFDLLAVRTHVGENVLVQQLQEVRRSAATPAGAGERQHT
uniref:Ring finger protein 183 n=1 Tax=Kryptolebias marmoratus TaxID=37003 RepID=A0A3Q3A7C6_KRYMA